MLYWKSFHCWSNFKYSAFFSPGLTGLKEQRKSVVVRVALQTRTCLLLPSFFLLWYSTHAHVIAFEMISEVLIVLFPHYSFVFFFPLCFSVWEVMSGRWTAEIWEALESSNYQKLVSSFYNDFVCRQWNSWNFTSLLLCIQIWERERIEEGRRGTPPVDCHPPSYHQLSQQQRLGWTTQPISLTWVGEIQLLHPSLFSQDFRW